MSISLLIGACSGPGEDVEIPFELRYAGRVIACDSSDGGPALTDMRFYVHDVVLLADDGRETRLDLRADGTWQSEEVALLDFEDGEGACLNGSPQTNTALHGTAAPGQYSGIRFGIGVPEHLNHEDPVAAGAPLGRTAMHWHWRSGYKFMRAGISNGDDGFWLHLGSSRCEGSIGNILGCRSKNRVSIELVDFVVGSDAIVIDLQALVSGIDLADGQGSDCSSGPAQAACVAPFAALGLDFASGEMTGSTDVFIVDRSR